MKTVIDSIKAEMQAARERVMAITGYSEEQINDMLFESAYEWLKYQGCDDHIQLQFASTKEFWGFWKMDIWHPSDMAFLEHYRRFRYDDKLAAQHYYQCFHYVQNSHMNSDVAAAGYHSLIKKLAVRR